MSAERPADGLSLNKSSVLGHLWRDGLMSAGARALSLPPLGWSIATAASR